MKLSQSLREDFLSELQLCISMTAVLSIAMDTSPDSHVRKIGDTHTHTQFLLIYKLKLSSVNQ